MYQQMAGIISRIKLVKHDQFLVIKVFNEYLNDSRHPLEVRSGSGFEINQRLDELWYLRFHVN